MSTTYKSQVLLAAFFQDVNYIRLNRELPIVQNSVLPFHEKYSCIRVNHQTERENVAADEVRDDVRLEPDVVVLPIDCARRPVWLVVIPE